MHLKQLQDLLRALKNQIDIKVSESTSLFEKIKDRYTKWNTSYTEFLKKDEKIEVSENGKESKEYQTLKKEAEKLIEKLTPTPKSESKLSVSPKKFFGFGARRNTVSSLEVVSDSSSSALLADLSPVKAAGATAAAKSKSEIKFVFKSMDDFYRLFEVDADKATRLVLQLVDPANLAWGVSALNQASAVTDRVAGLLIEKLCEGHLVMIFEQLSKQENANAEENSLLIQLIQNFYKHKCFEKFKASIHTALNDFGELASKTAVVGSRDSLTILQPVESEANKRDSLGQFKSCDTGILQGAFSAMLEAIFLSDDMPKSLLAVAAKAGDKSFAVLADVIHALIAEESSSLALKYDRQSILMVMLSTIPTLIMPAQSYLDGNDGVRKDLIGDRDEFRQILCAKIKSRFEAVMVADASVSANGQRPSVDSIAEINRLLSQRSFGRAHSRSAVAATFMGGGAALPSEVVKNAAAIAKTKKSDGSSNHASSSNSLPSLSK